MSSSIALKAPSTDVAKETREQYCGLRNSICRMAAAKGVAAAVDFAISSSASRSTSAKSRRDLAAAVRYYNLRTATVGVKTTHGDDVAFKFVVDTLNQFD